MGHQSPWQRHKCKQPMCCIVYKWFEHEGIPFPIWADLSSKPSTPCQGVFYVHPPPPS